MKITLNAFIVTAVFVATPVYATNGYAPHGIGMGSKGMGGVWIGYQPDAVALGGNPAGSAFMGNRLDLGLDIFKPNRKASITGHAQIPDGTYDGNDSDIFYIPEFGYRRAFNEQIAYALTVFGNGGMNTDYKNGIPLLNGGTAESTGINLMQLFVVPSVSFKLNERHALGVGLNIVAQGFKAEGLQSFDDPGFTSSTGNVTNNGTDWAYGGGVRFGWVGKLTPQLQFGATYQSRTSVGEFDEYAGLFAEQGGFDIPSNYGIGVAFKPTSAFTIAADIMQINFSETDSVGNSGQAMAPLGADNGPGFGWEDSTVIKIGVDYVLNESWSLRAGFNHGDAPIPASQTLFNMLAPATVEDHVTLGTTWTISSSLSLTFAYMHAFENTISGENSIGAAFGGGEADIKMSQDSFGISMAWSL